MGSRQGADFEGEYLVLRQDSIFKNEVLITTDLKNQIPANLTADKFNTNKKWLHFLSGRLDFGYSANTFFYQKGSGNDVTLTSPNGNFVLKRQDRTTFPIIPASTIIVFFKLKTNLQFRLNFTDRLLKSNLLKSNGIGLSRYFLIKKTGNPLFLNVIVNFSRNKTGIFAGEIHSASSIVINGKNLGNKTNFYLGEKHWRSGLGLGAEYRKKRICYFIEVVTSISFLAKQMLYFESQPNLFFTKRVEKSLSSGDILVSPTRFYHSISPLNVSFGVRTSFR